MFQPGARFPNLTGTVFTRLEVTWQVAFPSQMENSWQNESFLRQEAATAQSRQEHEFQLSTEKAMWSVCPNQTLAASGNGIADLNPRETICLESGTNGWIHSSSLDAKYPVGVPECRNGGCCWRSYIDTMGPFEISELVRDWHLKCSGGVFSDQEAHRCEMYQTRPSATSSTGLCGPLVGFYGNRKFSVKDSFAVVVHVCKCTNIF